MFRNTDELLEFISLHEHAESRDCEFKGVIKWDGDIRYKIAKSCLGMANILDGGNIIIGVQWDESKKRFIPVGLNNSDAGTFDNDTISAVVNVYADPPLDLSVKIFDHNLQKLVVIEVSESQDEPVICRLEYVNSSTGDIILENGAVYTRRKRMPETTKVTSVEMREITDRITKKHISDQLRLLLSAGLMAGRPPKASDEDKFKTERGDF